MPLEISEIGVHLAVGGATKAQVGPDGNPVNPEAPAEGDQGLTQAQIDQITDNCVKQVQTNLRQEEER